MNTINSTINVTELDVFDSFEHGAGVYVAKVVNMEPGSTSTRAIERGKLTLEITEVLRGAKRKNIVLPYAFIRDRFGSFDDPGLPVWQLLARPSSNSLLCVVVPSAEDPIAAKVAGVDEAASRVFSVNSTDDPQIADLRVACKLYDTAETVEFINEINRTLRGNQKMARRVALEATVMKLGRNKPDQAMAILKSYAQGIDKHSDTKEAERLINYIGLKFGSVEPWDQMNKYLCRCLVVLSYSPSPILRKSAITTLGSASSLFQSRPDFRLQDSLDASERKFLLEVLNAPPLDVDHNVDKTRDLLRK